MEKPYSVSSSESTSISTTTGNFTTTLAVSTGKTSVATYDPWRHTRMHLERNLEDLGSCLDHCDDLIEDDFEWYLDRVRRIFKNALQRKHGGLNAENS